MKAIILAAGNSKRLKPFTDNTPKCLLDISGKEILGRNLEHLQVLGITDITIVVGYLHTQIKEYCATKYPDIKVRFVNSVEWETTNNGYSLELALKQVPDDDSYLIIMNADTICHKDLIKTLIDSEYENALAVQKKDNCPEEDMKVYVNKKNNSIVNIGKELENAYGEFTGIFKFNNVTKVILLQHLNKIGLNCWFEEALRLHCLTSGDFYAVDVTHYPFMEIDFPEDLEAARDIFPYGQPDWEQGIRHGSKRNLDEAFNLLDDVTNILNKNGVQSYLNWGALLGVYRDGDFIPWDTDIDVSVFWASRDIVLNLVKDFETIGCFVPKIEGNCPGDFWVIRDKEKIEINFLQDINGQFIYEPDRCKLAAPIDYILPFKQIEFRGKKFNIPNKTEEYLRLSYGADWKTPIKGKKPKSL